jgi:hypothetical protein
MFPKSLIAFLLAFRLFAQDKSETADPKAQRPLSGGPQVDEKLPLGPLAASPFCAGSLTVLQQILDRLSTLEQQNRQLVEEVRSLREQVHAPEAGAAPKPAGPPLDEKVAVDEGQIAEQAQTKVEASQKFPIRLNGMLLFNIFSNSAYPSGESASDYGLLTAAARSGATVRQTLLGLRFDGPQIFGGGRVNGDLQMDFWGGYPDPGDNLIRLRQAEVSLDWANRSLSAGQMKPLISPSQPDSLAEVGIPPLAGAGNLWYWLPQLRYEERVHLGTNNGLTGQLALLQTEENYAASAPYSVSLDKARPAVEGRGAFWHKFDDTRRFEIGTGFHASTTHVNGQSVDSRIVSVDWLGDIWQHLQISGTFFHGENVEGLGTLTNGFTMDPQGQFLPIHSNGGWVQFAFPITNRLTFNVFGGLQNDRSMYGPADALSRNFTYASNFMYHLGPNVVVSLEGLQLRARDFNGSTEIHNHYDLAIGYLF